MSDIQLVETNTETLEGTGSYCLKSKKQSLGYINKNKWLNDRFEEGLKYIQLFVNKRQVGFMEYTDAEHSSRVVHASNYIVIHCLWVSQNGKGYGSQLIKKCLEDAESRGKSGVVVVTNAKTSWAPSKEIFLKNDFKLVDCALSDFELLAYSFDDKTETPRFPINWEERLNRFQNLTIIRSFQCPYVEIATENILLAANKLGLTVKIIDFPNREQLMELSPTPYGIFSAIYQGQLISFHRLTAHSVMKRLKQLMK